MKKNKKILSLLMTIIFLISFAPKSLIYVNAADSIKSTVINSDGTVTFNYQGDGSETKVIVKGSWDQNWTPVQMIKGSNNVWSATITLPKKALYQYGICTWSPTTKDQSNGDWKGDPLNSIKAADGNPLLVMSPIINNDDTITFYYVSKGDETKVIVKGSWDANWSPAEMQKDATNTNLWYKTLKLSPGSYEYGICTWSQTTKDQTNGDWQGDPLNINPKGGNPVVNAPSEFQSITVNDNRTVTFKFQGDGNTNSVNLAGDMNGWSSSVTPMTKGENNIWSATTSPINPGKHEYKFVLNGSNWITDPQNPNKSSGGNSLAYISGFYAINALGQVQQNTTTQVSGIKLNADGTDLTLTGVNWSVSPSSLASIDSNGNLQAKALPSNADNGTVTITGEKDGITVTKDMSVVRELSEQPGGKEVVLVGDIQTVAGASSWAPADTKTRMLYQGNGLYKITLKNVPVGNYQYKVAIGGSWAENYGANGASNGGNISLTVPSAEDVTFLYSDNTHLIVDTTTYVMATPKLSGMDVPENAIMQDYNLTGVYSCKIALTEGVHSDLVIADGAKKINVPPITIKDTSKEVTINYDAGTEIVFNDLSSDKLDISSLYFDSKDSNYKSIYGAVPTNSKITFNLRAKKDDLTASKLVILSGSGAQVIDMQKNGTFTSDANNQYDKWTADFKPTAIGMYQYYFVAIKGSDVKAYGDDDGYYGTGKADDLGKVGKYDLNVYDENFKTPDWLKNAVIYQIFPDRFFNGDTSNDYAETEARGDISYENVNNWYSVPEDPDIEYEKDSDGNIKKDSNGKPIINPNYKGNVGDGQWNNDVYGGDLKGIQDKLNYLKALGVNTLYINPISEASSNHRYDTKDYSQVDPMLGHMDDFISLVTAAHKMGMHLILDGVFNHVSDDSNYFDKYGKYIQSGKPIGAYQYWSRVYDLMNKQSINEEDAETKVEADFKAQGITDFHYKDWFIVKNQKDQSGYYEYNGWNGNDSMPEIQALNNSEYNVSSWANDIIDGQNSDSEYWLNEGSDGWRLDAADSVSDDTWKHFRPAIKNSNSQDVIIGEIWGDSSKYLLGNMFDSVMNYRFRGAIQEYVTGSGDAVQATKDLEKIREQYPKEAFEVLMNIVDSHDTERIISDLDGVGNDKEVAPDPSEDALAKMKLVPFIQMTYPGAPTIYYGDELGTPGSADPDDRRAMAWGKGNKDLVNWYAKLANIRNSYSVLRTGDMVPIEVSSDYSSDVLAYTRNDSSNHAIVIANRRTSDINGLKINVSSIPEGTVLTNALDSSEKFAVNNGAVTINVPAESGVILVANYTNVTVDQANLKDAYDTSYIVSEKIRVSGITIDSSISLQVGKTGTLTAKVSPENSTLKNVSWISSDDKIAKVDSNGIVTAIGEGTAYITATTVDGGYKSTCKVTVTKVSSNAENAGTGGGDATVQNSTVNLNEANLPKTGTIIDSSVLIALGSSMLIFGLIIVLLPTKRRKIK
ncbi:Ig-like domain-containing protein [Clostridium sp. 19966]|uniref:alpha-amylase family glycosyl hydrolase n=1 Tax=Clostridium sp. 19966 TaxID=2768166 RepID=UPI0028DE37E7|nr:alpha-amylase family glycosyl hydrolase [Clostridium sp. 19966]MDT8717392.1 Ig-like domain-containing protein [Clostridium sp. 19966]